MGRRAAGFRPETESEEGQEGGQGQEGAGAELRRRSGGAEESRRDHAGRDLSSHRGQPRRRQELVADAGDESLPDSVVPAEGHAAERTPDGDGPERRMGRQSMGHGKRLSAELPGLGRAPVLRLSLPRGAGAAAGVSRDLGDHRRRRHPEVDRLRGDRRREEKDGAVRGPRISRRRPRRPREEDRVPPARPTRSRR